MGRPFFIMIAGPNGSGKTTLTDALRQRFDLGTYINADEIALSLGSGDTEARARRAQKQALHAVESALSAGQDFSFETVMSHPSKIDLLGHARENGFFVRLFFVSTSNPTINLTRVVARVRRGGHDVPPDKIKSRYERSMSYLHRAAQHADEGAIFDNSSPYDSPYFSQKPLTLVGSFTNLGGFAWTPRLAPCPDWVHRYLLAPMSESSG